jgi:CheY-like chemotaxis protein/F0F1-type ATP synthase assembly protein I
LVEDNELNREVALGLLLDAHMTIDTAENGEVAVQMVRNGKYDLVMMDMQMPVMDGIAATKEIRRNAQFKNLPIIAMTANVMEKDREKCFAAGMNGHVSKPIDPDELFAALLKWIPAHTANSTAKVMAISPADSRYRHTRHSIAAAVADLNVYAERFVRSINDECLNRMIFIGRASLRRAIHEYMEHYHQERNHQRLGNRLAQANRPPENDTGPRQTADPSAIARGFRLSTELVAGVLVGAVIGWLLDRWLGISPWGLIVFLLLGFAAGVLNVMRAAGVVRDRQL